MSQLALRIRHCKAKHKLESNNSAKRPSGSHLGLYNLQAAGGEHHDTDTADKEEGQGLDDVPFGLEV